MKSRYLSALVLPLLILGLVTGCKSSSSTTGSGQGTSTSQSPLASGTASDSGSATTASGDCPTSNTTNFAKTKFVLHTGLAFGAFHRYLYKPFRAGAFQSGAHGRLLAFGKAGAAALFIKREIRLASEDVKANPSLCKLVAAPMQDIADKISGAVSSLKSGDVSAITGIEQTVQSVEGKSASAGTTIQEDENAPLK
jgi:uncharacterized protein YceK